MIQRPRRQLDLALDGEPREAPPPLVPRRPPAPAPDTIPPCWTVRLLVPRESGRNKWAVSDGLLTFTQARRLIDRAIRSGARGVMVCGCAQCKARGAA
jgi:hypothetical protein